MPDTRLDAQLKRAQMSDTLWRARYTKVQIAVLVCGAAAWLVEHFR